MTVETIMNFGLYDDTAVGIVNDHTEIFIRKDLPGRVLAVIAHGNWFQDNVLDHMEDEVESFTWQDDNKVYIDVK